MAQPPPRRPPPKGPELGAFPLDHFRECKEEIAKYYRCLEDAQYMAPHCRDDVRVYLQCRMDKGLMESQNLDTFGIPKTHFVATRRERDCLKEEQMKSGMGQIPIVADLKYPLLSSDGFEEE